MPTQTALFDEPVEGVGWPVNIYLDDGAWPAEELPLIASNC
jgi:hypothetical protein